MATDLLLMAVPGTALVLLFLSLLSLRYVRSL